MAIVSRKVSDLSGQEGTDAEFAQVVVRQHPKLDQPKALDVLVSELDQFKDIGDLVVLEVRLPDSSTRDIYGGQLWAKWRPSLPGHQKTTRQWMLVVLVMRGLSLAVDLAVNSSRQRLGRQRNAA